jgi:DNA-directed RNA polymerase subunit M/transcription elongation factor TFIIS
MPRFCVDCGTLLETVVNTGELVFECSCGRRYQAEASDTLLYESFVEVGSAGLEKYKDFIENSAYDKAGNKVGYTCRNCKIPYLTMIYLGTEETVVYTCTCGAIYSLADVEDKAQTAPTIIHTTVANKPVEQVVIEEQPPLIETMPVADTVAGTATVSAEPVVTQVATPSTTEQPTTQPPSEVKAVATKTTAKPKAPKRKAAKK